jgi:hypothetical protein
MNTDGTVKSHQKISATEGNFLGIIYRMSKFGNSVAYLGDINGDAIGDLAVGATRDSGGSYIGSVWILFMNSDGTVKAHQKISATEGNFSGILHDNDQFGVSISSMGDINDDNVIDLAVGAIGDDDGGTDKGAVWILLMNTDGTVKSHQKISSTMGNFNGSLDYDDYFSGSLASIGDLNGDGIVDIAVSAIRDDDGGTDKGAVWVLFLDYFPEDLDNDNMPDQWENKYGLNPNTNDAFSDPDGDGLTNLIEYKLRLNPKKSDTDDDGIIDGNEDKNHNGVVDPGETNPADADTDDDGMPDGWEVQYGLNPLVNDAEGDLDNDRFSNFKEYQKGTLPNDRKSRPKTGMPWLPLLLED